MKNFMKDIVDKFAIVGSSDTQFGAVCFSADVRGHFDLNDYSTKPTIKKGIQNISPANGGATAIGLGLQVRVIVIIILEIFAMF